MRPFISLSDQVIRNDKTNIFFDLASDRLTVTDFLKPCAKENSLLECTPLELAAQYQHWPLLKWMLSKLPSVANIEDGAARERSEDIFSKLLLISAFYHQTEIEMILLSMGAKLNKKVIVSDKFRGCGVLHFAVYYRSELLIKKLMEFGADPLASNVDQLSALDFAIFLARQHDLAYWQYIPLLTPKISSISNYAKVLLMAAVYNQEEVVRHLLSIGVDPNALVVKAGEFSGYSALHFAFHHNNKKIAFDLLAAGADPDQKADDGSSFRSLVGGYDPHLTFLLSLPSEKRIKSIGEYIKDFPENFSENTLQEPSFSEIFSSSIGAVREKIFSFFNAGSASDEMEAFERGHFQNKLEIKENSEQIIIQNSRINSLEQALLQFKKETVVSTPVVARNSVFHRNSQYSANARSEKTVPDAGF